MRDQIAETLVGAVVLAVAAVFLAYSLSAAERGVGGGYPLSAQFGSASGLTSGADVRLSGVKVGSVSAIRLDPTSYNAVVDFTVSRGVEIPTDSSVKLTNEGLLGGVFLEIEPGGEEEYLAPGEEISYGQGAIDVIRLLSEFVTGGGNSDDE